MAFWDDAFRVIAAPLTGGLSLAGLGSDKGVLGGVGDVLFGDTGKTDFNVPPYEVGRPTPLSQSAYRNPGTAQPGYLERLSAAQDRQAPQAGYAGTAEIPQYGGAKLSTGAFNQRMGDYEQQLGMGMESRGRQLKAIDLAQSAAKGEQPSAAQSQLQGGLERALKGQAAMAASSRGGAGARASAARQAGFAGADMQAQTIQQLAQLRAQEMAAARNELIGATQGLRSSDIAGQGIALNAADLALKPATYQAGLQQQAGMQSQALGAQAAMQGLDLTQAVNLANLGAGLTNQGQTDTYNLGLLSGLTDVDKAMVDSRIKYQQDLAAQNLAYENLGMQAFFEPYKINAGIAQANAAAETQNLGAGLGFFGSALGAVA